MHNNCLNITKGNSFHSGMVWNILLKICFYVNVNLSYLDHYKSISSHIYPLFYWLIDFLPEPQGTWDLSSLTIIEMEPMPHAVEAQSLHQTSREVPYTLCFKFSECVMIQIWKIWKYVWVFICDWAIITIPNIITIPI